MGEAPLSVSFNANQSYDPDGQAVNYAWDFGAGSFDESSATVHHLYTEAGSYQIVLTVTDDEGLQAVASGIVVVTAPALGGNVNSETDSTVFVPSSSMNSPLSGHYILTFDVTGIAGQIPDAKIRLFFDNPHDRITIYCGNNLITTRNNIAARQWYDIVLQDMITENKKYTVIVSYDPYQQHIQEQNQAELIVVWQ